MTLLVVGIGIPHVRDAELADALRDKDNEIFSFFLSFVVIGFYWLAHHRFFSRLVAVDVRFMKLNLVYLAAIAFMPFPTALVGQLRRLRAGRDRALRDHARVSPASWRRRCSGTRSRPDCSASASTTDVFRNYMIASLAPALVFAALDPDRVRRPEPRRCSSWLLIFPLEFLIGKYLRTDPRRTERARASESSRSVVVGGVEGDDDRRRGSGRSAQVDGSWCAAAHTRRLLGLAGEADAVGAELGVAQVDADAAGEPGRLRPRLGVVASRHRARHRRHHAAVDTEAAVELADVVEQRGRQPARVVGVRRVGEAGLHVAGDADGVALVVVGLAAELHEPAGGEHDLDPRRRRRRAAAPATAPARSDRRGDRASSRLSSDQRKTQLNSWSMTGSSNLEITPVEKTSTNSTRNP